MLERKRYRVRKVMIKPNKYFSKGDAMETISNLKNFKSNESLRFKMYTYKSGSVYSGEWLGGMR
jgi:hypothetical protein